MLLLAFALCASAAALLPSLFCSSTNFALNAPAMEPPYPMEC